MITITLNGQPIELTSTDRVIHLARVAVNHADNTGQRARLYCSGWDWTGPRAERTARVAGAYRPVPGALHMAEPARAERHGNGNVVPVFRHKQRPARRAPEPPEAA